MIVLFLKSILSTALFKWIPTKTSSFSDASIEGNSEHPHLCISTSACIIYFMSLHNWVKYPCTDLTTIHHWSCCLSLQLHTILSGLMHDQEAWSRWRNKDVVLLQKKRFYEKLNETKTKLSRGFQFSFHKPNCSFNYYTEQYYEKMLCLR